MRKHSEPSPVDFDWSEDENGNLIDYRAAEFERELEELQELAAKEEGDGN